MGRQGDCPVWEQWGVGMFHRVVRFSLVFFFLAYRGKDARERQGHESPILLLDASKTGRMGERCRFELQVVSSQVSDRAFRRDE
jgi:hypothetical protein